MEASSLETQVGDSAKNDILEHCRSELPTRYQVSEDDHMIPPDVERMFAKQMNATTISLASSHASLVSHANEVAKLILNAAKGRSSNK